MNKWNNYIKFAWWTASFMILVLFWDHYILKIDTSNLGYILVKGITISSLIFMGLYCYIKKEVTWQQEAYGILFYLYSLYGMAYLDMTYSFSFIEAFFIISIGARTTPLKFCIVSSVGLVGFLIGHYYAREPLFVALGQSYKPHSVLVTFIFFVSAFLIHFMIARQQNIINELNAKFALVGKQSSFLMHEIKNPLNRVVANAEEDMSEQIMQDIRRDSQKISALVNSVEILIHDPKSLVGTFTHFDWRDIGDNLFLDFNSYLSSMNIKCNFSELAGSFYGNQPLLYQLLKNHIVNAIEAIGFNTNQTSEIKISVEPKGDRILLVATNTNSTIPKKDLERIFEPHFTTKKRGLNKGLGLALAKNIVEAHHGHIIAVSDNGRTTFEINFPIKKS
jgi:signal transduction histidine kinase